jgi:TolA-binding protein
MFQSPIYACVVYLAVVSLAGLASLKAIHRKIRTMNDTEKAEFQKLNDSLESLSTVVDNFRTDNHDLKAQLETVTADRDALKAQLETVTADRDALKAQLAALPPPAADDTAEVVAAVQVAEAKVAGILTPTVPPAATPTTPADPNAPPAA